MLRQKPRDMSVDAFVRDYAPLVVQFQQEWALMLRGGGDGADGNVAVERALGLMRWWQRRAVQCAAVRDILILP